MVTSFGVTPATGFVSLILLLLSISMSSTFSQIIFLSVFLLILMLLTRPSLSKVMVRLLFIIPFALVSSIAVAINLFYFQNNPQALDLIILLLSKIMLSALSVSLFSTLFSAHKISEALYCIGVPAAFCVMLRMVFRYFESFYSHLTHLIQAQRLRGFSAGKRSISFKRRLIVVGQTITYILHHSMHHAEGVFFSMRLRGFHRNNPPYDCSISFIEPAQCICILIHFSVLSVNMFML